MEYPGRDDPVTWPEYYGHPNDPRAPLETDEDDEPMLCNDDGGPQDDEPVNFNGMEEYE